MSDTKRFNLPDVGEGLTEAEILNWRVAPGDEVKVNQIIVEIETAKSAVELPSPYDGVVGDLLVNEGQTVEVGTPIITFGDGEAAAQGTENDGRATGGGAEPAAEEDSGRQAMLVGSGPRAAPARRRPRKNRAEPKAEATEVPSTSRGAETEAWPAPSASAPAAAAPAESPIRPGQQGAPPEPAPGGDRGSVLAKPPVRKLAKDLGVDLRTVTPSGPGGTVTRGDVSAAAGSSGQVPAQQALAFDASREQRIPVKGVRKHVAAAMVSSAFTAPHVTEFLTVDATPTVEAVERLQRLPDFAEVRVSPLLLAAKALLIAIRRNPMINSSWDEQAQEIVVKDYVNLGIAVASSRGLVVPNIKDAGALSLSGLGHALGELVGTARAGKTPPPDMQGGTVTITNVGIFGVDTGTPILNPGETAILALGAIREQPWVHEGEIAVRSVVQLSVSFDHRIVDGELGSRFLADIGAMLADPTTMLAWS